MTLAEWMVRYHDDLDEVVLALCEIFDLPNPPAVQEYVEAELEQQARLLLIVDGQTILGLAGWNWAHADHRATVLPIYFGVRRNFGARDVRALLVTSVVGRLTEERERSERIEITSALLQFPPGDRMFRQICQDLGYGSDKRRNDMFKQRLGARGSLYSRLARL